MIYCGIDYSYLCPSICFYDDSKPLTFNNLKFYAYYTVEKHCRQVTDNILIMKQPKYSCPEERFLNISRWSEAVLLTEKPGIITMEGYAMGASNTNNICQTAENTSLLKQMMYRNKLDFEILAPSSIKKKFSGMGNAKKPEMIAHFEALLNVNMRVIMDILDAKDPKPIDDLVDSFAILTSSSHFMAHHPEFNVL